MARWIAALPHDANSGDVYASLEPGRLVRRAEGARPASEGHTV